MPRPKGSKNKPKPIEPRNYFEDIKYVILCFFFLGSLALTTFVMVLVKGRAFTGEKLRLLFEK